MDYQRNSCPHIDDERIYGYRALRFARNDKTQLPGFDQDPFAFHSKANERTIESIVEEYEAVRMSTITLFNGFSDDVMLRRGIANNNEATVRALATILPGTSFTMSTLLRACI